MALLPPAFPPPGLVLGRAPAGLGETGWPAQGFGAGWAAHRPAPPAWGLLAPPGLAQALSLLDDPTLPEAAAGCALLIAWPEPPGRAVLEAAAEAGVQEVWGPADGPADPAAWAVRLTLALARQARARRALEDRLSDPETGLPARPQMRRHVQQLMALRQREPAAMGLLLIDLPGLRERPPAEHGPLRRKAVARLRSVLRGSDGVGVDGDARLSVWLPWLDQPASLAAVAAKLQAVLERPLSWSGAPLALRPRVAAAGCPPGSLDEAALWRQAEAGLDGLAPLGPGAGFRPHPVSGSPPAANDPGPPG